MRGVEAIGRRAEPRAGRRRVAVRSGQSSSLVLQGEAGVGRTALLEYVVQHEGCYRVLSVAGVQAEIELAFAGLHEALVPVIDHVAAL